MHSSSAAQGLWLGLKSKVQMAKRVVEHKVSVSHVADDVISLKRQQKAIKFLQAVSIADKYDATEGELFQGQCSVPRLKNKVAQGHSNFQTDWPVKFSGQSV